MNKKFTRKLGAMTLATVLAFGGIVGTVNAEEQTTPTISGDKIYNNAGTPQAIGKKFAVNSKNTMPVETFKFKIEGTTTEGPVLKYGDKKENTATIKSATADIISLKSNELKFGEGETPVIEQAIGLTIDATKAKEGPGIYRAKIREEKGVRKGLTYDTAARYIDLYLAYGEDGKTLEVKNTVVYKEVKDDQGKVTEYVKQDDGQTEVEKGKKVNAAVVFKNLYFKSDENTDKTPKNVDKKTGDEDENQEYTISVGKEISKESVDRDENREFKINVTLTGQVGDRFTAYKLNTNGEIDETNKTVSEAITKENQGKTITISVKHGEKYKIFGLTKDDKIKAVEQDAKDEFNKTGEIKEDKAISELDKDITIVNTSKSSTPTGLIQNMAPYAVILSVAVIGGTLYVKTKKEKEELA